MPASTATAGKGTSARGPSRKKGPMSYIGQTTNPGRGDNPRGFPRPTRRARPVHFAHDIKDTPRALLTKKHVEKTPSTSSAARQRVSTGPLSTKTHSQEKRPTRENGTPVQFWTDAKPAPCHIPACKVSYAIARAARVLYPESTKAPRARSH